MAPLALVLHLVVATPDLALRDPGPFQGSELAAASVGVVTGDALVLGAGYLTLQLFAKGTFDPSAANFRTAAYALGVSALLVPPLTAVLFALWARAEPASGAFWKAMLLAAGAQAVALAAGVAASPRFWVILPIQLVGIGLGASLGLHWGPRAPVPSPPDLRRETGAVERLREQEPADPAPTALRRAQCVVG
jgi:hypothetical protein